MTAGDTITITVPTSGIDPDGDLTYVAGIVGQDGDSVDLSLGRVTSFGATTVKYEAYPRSAGTEVIRYVVRDRFGATSEAFIRVGVVQPGDPQPPIAVLDDIVAAPGRSVNADVLANDLISPDDEVTLTDLSQDQRARSARAVHQARRQHVPGRRTRGGPGQGPLVCHHGRPLRPLPGDADGPRPEGVQQPADRHRRHRGPQGGGDVHDRRRPRQRPRRRRRPEHPAARRRRR